MTKNDDKYGLSELESMDEGEQQQTKRPTRRPRPTRSSPALSVLQKDNKAINHVNSALSRAKEAEKALAELEERYEKDINAAKEKQKPFEMIMPITKTKVRFEEVEVDPSLIDVSIENERDQSLLDEISLSDILPKIRLQGQSKPGILRPKGKRFELIDGSRRLACTKILEIKFKALVGDVPDGDVRELSEVGNTYKKPSPYEKAKFYERLIKDGEFKSWNNLAAAKGISQSTASRLKACADLEEVFVRCFVCPTDMPTRFGETIAKLLKENKKGVFERAKELVELRNSDPDSVEVENIVAELKKASKKPVKKLPGRTPVIYKNTDSSTSLKFSTTNKGATKFEISGADEKQLNDILELINKKLKLAKSK